MNCKKRKAWESHGPLSGTSEDVRLAAENIKRGGGEKAVFHFIKKKKERHIIELKKKGHATVKRKTESCRERGEGVACAARNEERVQLHFINWSTRRS